MKFEIKNYRLDHGKHCFISRRSLNDFLADQYGRNPKETCIKVFDNFEIKEKGELQTIKWGDKNKKDEPRLYNTVYESTQIQNICAWHGLAPRVYGIETVKINERYYLAQVSEYLDGEFAKSDQEAIQILTKVKKLGKKYNFHNEKNDVSRYDVIDGKLIDFQTLFFYKDYKKTVKEIYIKDANYGKRYYHKISELNLLGGPRDNEARKQYMQLNKINFKNKRVLDVGCASGYFCQYADDMGAKKVIGLDNTNTIHAAFNLANLKGYWNIDFKNSAVDNEYNSAFNWPYIHNVECEHNKIDNSLIVKGNYFKFDIIFFLSMYMHIGLPDEIYNSLEQDGLMIFEKNGRETDEQVEQFLKTKFKKVKLIGKAADHGNKPIYWCRHKKV